MSTPRRPPPFCHQHNPGQPPRRRNNRIGWLVALGIVACILLLAVGFAKLISGRVGSASTPSAQQHNARCPACGHESSIQEHTSTAAQSNWEYTCPNCLCQNSELALRMTYRHAHKTAAEKDADAERQRQRNMQSAEERKAKTTRMQTQHKEYLREQRDIGDESQRLQFDEIERQRQP